MGDRKLVPFNSSRRYSVQKRQGKARKAQQFKLDQILPMRIDSNDFWPKPERGHRK